MSAQELLQHYLRLAHQYEHAGQIRLRDRCLVLAIDVAWQSGRINEATRLWQRLKQANPDLYLCAFASLEEAMQRPEVKEYLNHEREGAAELSSPPWGVRSDAPASGTSVPPSPSELMLPLDTSLLREGESVGESSPNAVASASSEQAAPRQAAVHDTAAHSQATPPSNRPAASSAPVLGRAAVPKVLRSPVVSVPNRIAAPSSASRATSATAPSHADGPDLVSACVAASLAILVALLGLILAAYVLLAPFLPDWLGR